MKAGFKSTEFASMVASVVAFLTAAINGNLPPAYATVATSVLVVAYGAFRTWLKVKNTEPTATPPPAEK